MLSIALLLDHLGLPEAARRVEAAVAFDLATRQSGSVGRTSAIGDRLAASPRADMTMTTAASAD